MDILKRILFSLLLVGIIGGEVLRIDNGQSIAITFLDITVGLFVVGSLLINIFQKKKISLNIEKYVVWFVVIGLVSLLFNLWQLTLYQFFVAFLYALRFVFYTIGISISISLFGSLWKKHIPYFLFLVSTILSLLGFVQYLLYPALRNLYYAGWDEHLYRIFSTFLDPNFMGLFYVCGVIVGIYSFFESLHQEKRSRQFLFGVATLLNLLALFLTYSRGAYLAFIVAVIVILWRAGKKKFILVACGVLVLLIVGIELLSPHSEGTKLFRTASIRDRAVSLSQVTTIIAHHPILGVGFDAYRYAQQKEGFLKTNPETTHSGAGTDNSFLFVLATTGIVGLGFYLLMTYKILVFSYRSKTLAGRTLFASYVALMIGSFFVNAFFYPFLLVLVWLLIGSKNTEKKNEKNSIQKLSKSS